MASGGLTPPRSPWPSFPPYARTVQRRGGGPPMAFRVQRRVDFCETDVAGIVHFSNYFRYMEHAEVAFLRARGLNVSSQWHGEHLGFPRVAARCDYKKPARFDEVVDIDVTLERLGTKSVTYAFV